MSFFSKIFNFISSAQSFKEEKYFLDDYVHTYKDTIPEKTAQFSSYIILKRVSIEESVSYVSKIEKNNIFKDVKFKKNEKCIITDITVKLKSSTLPCKSKVYINLKFENEEEVEPIGIKISPGEKNFTLNEKVYTSLLNSTQIGDLIGRECFLEYLPTKSYSNVSLSNSNEKEYFGNNWVVKKDTFWPSILYSDSGKLRNIYKDGDHDFNIYKVKDNESLCTINNNCVNVLTTKVNDTYFSKMKYSQVHPSEVHNYISFEFDKNDKNLNETDYFCQIVIDIKYISVDTSELKLERHKFRKIESGYL